ncbi:MAG: hypothetical protein ACLQU5_03725 [Isosphaeraceae bacterium]
MLFGNRGTRSSGTKQRKSEAFRPRGEALEPKVLLALLQLGAGTPQNIAGNTTTAPAGPQTIGGQLPFIADSSGLNQVQGNQTTDPGLGVLETGNVQAQGAGYSVAGLGDMNLDGSNDYLIGAPTVVTTTTPSGSVISPGTGDSDRAFLVFGNRSATPPSVQSWLSATPEQRVGVLANVGGALQFNPFTDRGQPYNYSFDGITFITSQSSNSQLGAFVAAAGPNAFVIGAPNYTGGGRLYYITATSNFNLASLRSAPVDLDFPQNYPGLTILTFEDTANPTSGLGSSFADVPNLFGDGVDDLVIGEPGASLNGKTGNGGVFVFPVTSVPLTMGSPNNVVQVQAEAPFKFVGANSGDGAGFSVANAGDVNGVTTLLGSTNDLLIGAPNANNKAGAAYLVYGGTPLTSGAVGGVVDLSLLSVPPTVTGAIPPAQGAVFVGSASGDLAGYAVSGAGNFDPSITPVYSSFMIGSPGAGGGRVNLFYGTATGTLNSTGLPLGLVANAINPINLGNPGVTLPLTGYTPKSASFVGAANGDRAGFSLSYINAGAGAKTASRILIGAPSNATGPGGSGSVYEIQGPTTGMYTTQLVQLNSSVARQYTLAFPTTFSGGNTVGFGNSVSAYANGNGDFIAGAPGYTGTLATGSPPITLVGAAAVVLDSLQPANSLIPLGSSPTPTPTPTPTIGSGPVAGAVLPGTFVPTNYIPPLGTNFVPTDSALSALNYAPIPLKVALQQYLPPDGFIQRDYAYTHPGRKLPPTLEERGQTQSRHVYGSSGVWTLGSKVFTRGRFHPGKTYRFTHKGRVVPASASRERYTSKGNPLGKV